MAFSFPRIYPILDSLILDSSILDSSIIPPGGRGEFLHRLGSELAASGVTLLEYRNKTGSDGEILSDAAILRAAMPGQNIKLILDDRVDLVEQCGFDGVHVDTGDLPAAEARRLLGPTRMVGAFGGSDGFLPGMLEAPADYLAIGPVYPTTTKQTGTVPIGLEGVRRLREQAGRGKILTAAAGITLETAPSVLAAGASAVAVAAAIFRAPNPAAEFRRWLAVLS
jgi:thiamine-phosphate pyrophosphorylase